MSDETTRGTAPHASAGGQPERGQAMASTLTPAQIREEVALFAATYPTPNVRRAVALAEAGDVTYEQIHGLFTRSLGSALAELA